MENCESKISSVCDLFVIGGGINGCGIARDAAGNGLKVILVEAGDIASQTSSASTKLIHGGLRYLEFYEFRLVREALKERERLLKIAPHIIRPLKFILPYIDSMRPKWLIRAGLFLYDNLAKRKYLAGSGSMKILSDLKSCFKDGFHYSDCWVDDARLVILNAMDASNRGAEICVGVSCVQISKSSGCWEIELSNGRVISAGMIVNASGANVRKILDDNDLALEATPKIRLVKGSHIIVDKMFKGDDAYILQQSDDRIVFAIPYEGEFTLIGTTDISVDENDAEIKISEAEKRYLCDAVNSYFDKEINLSDVKYSYSGVRPLFDDGKSNHSKVTRDYHLQVDDHDGLAIISIFGGKITTYRKLSEHVMEHISKIIGGKLSKWTSLSVLPGGGIEKGYFGFKKFKEQMFEKYNDVPFDVLNRMLSQYGTMIDGILSNRGDLYNNGKLYKGEVEHLVRNEWVKSIDDLLWRRTKLGMVLSSDDAKEVEADINAILRKDDCNG